MTKEAHEIYHSERVPRHGALVQLWAVEVFMRLWELDLDLEALIEELTDSARIHNPREQ